jgi:hypothetical protein
LLLRADVRLIDFRAHFNALQVTPAEVTLDDTGHLNPRGHALVADVLERAITADGHRAHRMR